MLNITSQAGFSGSVNYTGISQGLTVSVVDINPFSYSMVQNSMRSGLDHLWTGTRKFADDHDCDNVQLSAVVGPSYVISGPSVSTASDAQLANSSGYTTVWSSPDNGCLFSYQKMKSLLGTSVTKELMFVQCLSRSLLNGSSLIGLDSEFYIRCHARLIGSNYYSWFEYTSAYRLQPDVSSAVLAQAFSLTFMCTSSGLSPDYTYGKSIYVYGLGRLSTDPSNYGRRYYLSETAGWTTSPVAYCTLNSRYPVSLATYTDMYTSPVAWMNKINPVIPASAPFLALSVVPTRGTFSTASLTVSRVALDTMISDLKVLTKESPILTQSTNSLVGSFDWGDLCDTCIDNIMQGNTDWISNAKDFRTTGDTVRSIIRLISKPRDAKTWADAFLSLDYGDRLTVLDSMATLQQFMYDRRAVWSKPYQTAYATKKGTFTSSSTTSHSYQAVVKIYYLPKSLGWFGDTYRFATKWGVWPSTQTMWNVIPFSFVVDWFANVGNFFHDFDRSIYMEYITVLSVSRSLKDDITFGNVSLGNYVLQGCTAKRYDRRLGETLFTSPFRCDRGHLTTIDIVSGAALAAQIIL